MGENGNGEAARGERHGSDQRFRVGLARAFGGAIFFSLPLLMTMEMWWLGFYLDRTRLALFLVATLPLVVGLTHFAGFEETTTWVADVVDAAVALAVGFVASAAVLLLTNIVHPGMPAREVIGKVSLEAIPASIGAALASSQLGGRGAGRAEDERKQHARYGAEAFFMAAGALFFAFHVAPTEEIVLIAYRMTAWHAIALATVTAIMMHAFVYGAGFRGAPSAPPGTPGWSLFLRFSLPGYAIALAVAAYVLWTFGRFEGHSFSGAVLVTVVLGFPAGLGAAAARLIL